MPPSSVPPPPPKHGSGPLIGAVIVMLLLMGGLVVWKMSGSEEKQAPAPAPPTSVAQEPGVDQVVPAPPPPPPPPAASAEDAGAPTSAKKSAVSSTTGTGCPSCGSCTGEPAPSFTAVLRTRANQAQHCYEKALAQQESLQGRMTVNLCVGVGGSVCSASVSNDSLGSPMVAQCVTNIYRATTFPSPKNGCVDARVPLNFMPEKK
ncbi:MAG TPA: AgmX/PglI C-terminal domain-containing protein [Polyangiaceae bacterium]|nr:AgmX/PglI C-terminal domain-containing protein [Polyangiaceae bacterium]